MKEVSLQELQRNYTENLCNKRFIFTLKNERQIKIEFFQESMCHLMGLQHIYGKDKHYLGAQGYQKILQNKITTKVLKKHNKKEYNFIKERLERFDEIIDVLRQGKLFYYSKEKVKGNTYIQADFLMFKENEEYILHLFLIQERNTEDIFVPISFVPQSQKDNNLYKFVEGQREMKIIKREEISTI